MIFKKKGGGGFDIVLQKFKSINQGKRAQFAQADPDQLLLANLLLMSTDVLSHASKNCYIIVNLFPNKPCFLGVCSTSLFKTLWEKEKLLVTSNFSFFHSVFYPL